MNIQHGERIVEIPWMYAQLQKYKGKILDIGSAGTDLGEIRRQKRVLVRVDRLLKEVKSSDKETIYPNDIRDLSSKKIGHFDVVMLISTLEHIGLDAYGYKDRKTDPWTEQINVLLYCARFLSANGVILLTLPYGKEEDGGWYLVYNAHRLRDLINPFEVLELAYFALDFDTWTYNHVSADKCHNLGQDWVRSDFSRASNVVCLVLRRKNV